MYIKRMRNKGMDSNGVIDESVGASLVVEVGTTILNVRPYGNTIGTYLFWVTKYRSHIVLGLVYQL